MTDRALIAAVLSWAREHGWEPGSLPGEWRHGDTKVVLGDGSGGCEWPLTVLLMERTRAGHWRRYRVLTAESVRQVVDLLVDHDLLPLTLHSAWRAATRTREAVAA